jgi:transposase
MAIQYFLNEYPYLTGYLKAGFLNIDNGFNERMIRYFAIGRNNWIFADTVNGAHASSLLYSFVVTARANKLEPFTVLRKIFEEIPLAQSLEDYERITEYLLKPSPA